MKNIIKNIASKFRQKDAGAPARVSHVENNLHLPQQFTQRLLIEKRRAERLNSVCSMIVFDATNLNGGNGHAVPAAPAGGSLVKRICSLIRETDVVSLYQKNLILILLPDTDAAAARCVYERLTQQLGKSRQEFSRQEFSREEKFNLDKIAMDILSYPEKSIGKRPSKNAVVMPASTDRRNAWKEPFALRASRVKDFDSGQLKGWQLGIGTPSAASIAIPIVNAFLWGPQFVSDFVPSVEKTLKRALDLVGAIAGLLLLSPLLFLTAILIKATSRGPVLFKQKRLGYQGEYFTFLKFRTMYNNCENRIHQEYVKRLIHGKNGDLNNGSQEQPFYKIKNDPRITLLGRFLRKTSIDELPQLWNVLAGDMSLVGPRPPLPYEVEEYQNWHYRRIMEAKPGITGLWQVSGRNRTTFDEMVRLDLFYARNWSLSLDFKILLKTVKVMLMPNGV